MEDIKMIIRLGKLQVRLYATILAKRTGVCSQRYGEVDKHMILWDFDRSTAVEIAKTLECLMLKYNLPDIYIIQSSPKGSYHAYCFASRSFLEVLHILSDTPQVDRTYLRLGVVRGYFTLRITPRKGDTAFKLVKIITSTFSNEMDYSDMTINEYLTSNKGRKNAKGK